MTRLADGPVVEVSIDITASLARVWEFVADINLPSRFQGEFRGAEWIDAGPALGAAFKGRNGIGDGEWETTSWVVAYEPRREFGWAVSDRVNPGATWTFRLEPAGEGTSLTFHRLLGQGSSGVVSRIARYPGREEEIIAARDATHRANMQRVIEGIKELAEAG